MDLIAKVGGFVSGMTEAERAADKSAKKIQASIESISVAGYAVGNALGQYLKQGIDLAINAFPELIEQAGQFQDLAEKTGGSAEGIASLAVSAKVGGTSVEDLASASIKLTKNLTGVDDQSKAAGAALAALGIPVADFKKLAPEQQLLKVADALGGFAEGAGKTAVATDLFGKAGAQLLPTLKDLYEQGGAQKILTDEQIKQADDFGDGLTRTKTQIGLYASAIATQALPSITALTEVLKDAIVQVYDLDKAAADAGKTNPFATFSENVGRELAKVLDYFATTKQEFAALADFGGSAIAALKNAAVGNAEAARGAISDFQDRHGLDAFFRKNAAAAGAAEAKTYVQAFNDNLAGAKRSAFAANDPRRVDLGPNGKPADTRATLNYSGVQTKKAGGGADDPTKRLLDNDLAAYKAQADQAKELLADRNKILDLYNSQGLLSVKDYYAALQGNLDEATRDQAKAYDDQIAALEKYRAAASKQTDVADATGKINKLQDDKAKLYRQAGNEAIAMSVKEGEAAKAVKNAFDEVNAKVLEYQGNLRAAAAIRFDASNEKLLTQATAEHNDKVKEQIALLKQYTLAQADITKATDAFSLAQGDLQIQEDRITLAQQRGTMGEIAGLRASGEARAALIPGLQTQLDALLAINQASLSPAQVQSIERLKLQLDQLKASVDPLADKFNTMFGDAAGSAFGDFITGAKSASDAFKDFATSVTNQIGQLVAKDLANTLFKSIFGNAPGSNGNGVGGMLSSLLGGSSGSGSLLGKLLGGGGSGSAALAGANAVGGAGGDALGAFIGLSGFAGGGYTGMGAANDPAGIVHKNEVVWSQRDIANAGGVGNVESMRRGGGTVVHIHQSFSPGTTRQTVDQGAKAAALAAQRAIRRNG
jgi:hypothetical protein